MDNAATSTTDWSWARCQEVAFLQRRVQLVLLLRLFLVLLPILVGLVVPSIEGGLRVIALLFVLALSVFQGWLVYKLASAMLWGRWSVLVGVVSVVSNLVGILCAAIPSSRATVALKRRGVRVGLLGAVLGETPPPTFRPG